MALEAEMGSQRAGSLPWEPGLGLWLLLMDWDGLSRLGRSLGSGEVRAEPQEKGGELPPEALWLW